MKLIEVQDKQTWDAFTAVQPFAQRRIREDQLAQPLPVQRAVRAEHAGAEGLGEIQAFTKWVPHPGPMSRQNVEQAIAVSLRRMGVDRLDLLQFHWWDYQDRRYLDALRHLADLRQEGRIRHLALTNFDTERLGIIIDAGIPIVSNQVQYSLVDRRPNAKMAAFCPQPISRMQAARSVIRNTHSQFRTPNSGFIFGWGTRPSFGQNLSSRCFICRALFLLSRLAFV